MGARRGVDGLTDNERAICLAVDAGYTDKEAFRLARPNSRTTDHSASVGAARVRKRPHCVAFLKKLQAETLARHARHKDQVIDELANIAFSDVGDLICWGPDGVTVKDVAELTPAQRRLVAKVGYWIPWIPMPISTRRAISTTPMMRSISPSAISSMPLSGVPLFAPAPSRHMAGIS